jgi:MFS superfamily sulfate permease-like transporter
MLGRVPGSRAFVPLGGDSGAEPVPGLAVLMPQGPIFFANSQRVRDGVRAALALEPRPKQVLLNLGASPRVGVAACDLIEGLRQEASALGVELALARVSKEAREVLRRDGLLARLGEDQVFASQNDAVDAYLARHASGAGS